jgi:hypothetical protein
MCSLCVKQGGVGTFAQFLGEAAPGYVMDVDRLRYDLLIGRYQELFGRDRVVVLAYEHWLADPDAFLRAVAAAVPAPVPDSRDLAALPVVNRALSDPSRWVLRQTNRYLRRSRYNQRPRVMALESAGRLRRQLERVDRRLIPGVSTKLSAADERSIADLLPQFAASNARLADPTGLPLGELGYPMPESAAAATGLPYSPEASSSGTTRQKR